MDDIFRSIGNGDEIIHPQCPPVNIVESTIPNKHDKRQASEKGIQFKISGKRLHRMAVRPFYCQDKTGGIVNEFMQREFREMAFHDLVPGFFQGAGQSRG